MSMMRKIMRNMIRRQQAAERNQASGSVRAGMHQKAEHEFRHVRMTGNAHWGDLPEMLPLNDESPAAEEIAESDQSIEADPGILEEIADPEMSANEEEALGRRCRVPDVSGQRVCMAADYSGERIPVLDPVTGGTGADGSTPLVYSPGDGSLKEISYPPSETGQTDAEPFFPEQPVPSANVPEAPETAGTADEGNETDILSEG